VVSNTQYGAVAFKLVRRLYKANLRRRAVAISKTRRLLLPSVSFPRSCGSCVEFRWSLVLRPPPSATSVPPAAAGRRGLRPRVFPAHGPPPQLQVHACPGMCCNSSPSVLALAERLQAGGGPEVPGLLLHAGRSRACFAPPGFCAGGLGSQIFPAGAPEPAQRADLTACSDRTKAPQRREGPQIYCL
jgi:hypothetical protein